MPSSKTRHARRVTVALILILGAWTIDAALTQSQKEPAEPAFEVATIKLDPACRPGQGEPSPPSPGRLRAHCMTLKDLIQVSYVTLAKKGVLISRQELEITGGPNWVGSDHYDLEAKAEGNPGAAQMNGPMMRELLGDRFQLKIHRETKQGAIYALTVAKSGLKLQPAKEGGCVVRDLDHPLPPPAPGQPRPNFCGEIAIGMRPDLTLEGHGMTMATFTDGLDFDGLLDRPVIDKTGFTGIFDFYLKCELGFVGGGRKNGAGGRRGGGDDPAPPIENTGPSILAAALQEQLGLKVTPEKGPVEFLVIDHVERPSAN
jgi:uncharacterized protein (TIGR03435 family)